MASHFKPWGYVRNSNTFKESEMLKEISGLDLEKIAGGTDLPGVNEVINIASATDIVGNASVLQDTTTNVIAIDHDHDGTYDQAWRYGAGNVLQTTTDGQVWVTDSDVNGYNDDILREREEFKKYYIMAQIDP
jgi:hypothetical protein